MHYFLTHRHIHIKVSGNETSINEIKFLENSIENDRDIKLNSFWSDSLGQLEQYLKGKVVKLNIKTSYTGSEFQLKVWDALKKTKYGETITYGELAKKIGVTGGARAVGGACNKNPLPLIIPCHRVVASNGRGGFAGGKVVKNQLLRLESKGGLS